MLSLVTGGGAAAAPTPEQNMQVVGAFGEAVFGRKDFSVLPKLMREDYIQHNPLVPQGRQGFQEFFGATFAAIPDWRYTLKQIVADGDRVRIYGTYSGTHSGAPWLGIAASGREFAIDTVDIFRLQDGQLAEHWDVMDVRAVQAARRVELSGRSASRGFPSAIRMSAAPAHS